MTGEPSGSRATIPSSPGFAPARGRPAATQARNVEFLRTWCTACQSRLMQLVYCTYIDALRGRRIAQPRAFVKQLLLDGPGGGVPVKGALRLPLPPQLAG